MGLEQWGASEQYNKIASGYPEYELGRVLSQEKDLFRILDSGMVIDTPGMRELGMWKAENSYTEDNGQVDYPYGEPLWKPEMKEGNPIRLYTISEISKIFSTLGMSVCKSYADYTGKPSSDNDIQLMVYSLRS